MECSLTGYDELAAPKNISIATLERSIRENAGILSRVASDLDLSRQTVHKRIKSSTQLQQVLEETAEVLLDVCECHIIRLLHEGHLPTVFWYLDRKGRSRGYGRVNSSNEVSDAAIDAFVKSFGADTSKMKSALLELGYLGTL